MSATYEADVIVVGAGVAGLAAAVCLQDAGLTPLVLETAQRVGGRMTSDRVNGFVIDRGVTILGKTFSRMRALATRFGLGPLMRPTRFALGIRDVNGTRRYRAQRPHDVLLDRRLPNSARRAYLRMGLDLLRYDDALVHGLGDKSAFLDTENSLDYLRRLGGSGDDLFRLVLEPGLRGAMGGSVAQSSRAVLLQTARNTMAGGFWNLSDGVDRIPEALAAHVPVRTGTQVSQVRWSQSGVEVDAVTDGSSRTLHARGVILAVPGQIVPSLCPALPDWIAEPLRRTPYSAAVSAHVALQSPPACRCAGVGVVDPSADGLGVFELEHLRAPGRCPDGTGMVSAYFIHSAASPYLTLSDDDVRKRALAAVHGAFPDTAGKELFVHIIRWPTAIAQFPVGRLAEITRVRKQLGEWHEPLDLCGDYLDGLSSEGALRTGEQAAVRLAQRLGK